METRHEILEEDYVPPNLPGRDPQIKELKFCLEPCTRCERPQNVLLFGKPGTGKTAVARYVLSQLRQQSPAEGLYLNLWQCPTLHSILDKIMQKKRFLDTFQQNTSLKLDKLAKKLRGQMVLVLDEIDWPSPKERNGIIYNLSTMDKISLILIANSRKFILSLDGRVKSRLNPATVEFPNYSDSDLVRILRERAELALPPEAWSEKILRKMADISAGDARVAIQTLRCAALSAERKDRPISQEDVKEGWEHAKNIKKAYTLEKLGIHYKILFQIVKEKGQIESSGLYKKYRTACKEAGIKPASRRSYFLYVNNLTTHKLLEANMRKKGRVFEVG